MPIKLTQCDECPLCHGFSWTITDELRLAELVARLMLGHYRHVQRVLNSDDNAPSPQVSDSMIDDLVVKIGLPATDTHRYHRDGWVFQMISWVAAKIAEPEAIMAIPHSQAAQKGFDNLIIQLANRDNEVTVVVISEDKATENSRNTVTSKVWPELVDFESGRRDHELVNEVTSILERYHKKVDVDKVIADIFWDKARHYRISITTDCIDDEAHRKTLFGGYNIKVAGHEKRRRAETIKVEQLRPWMDAFCVKIAACLEDMRCTIQ